MVKVIPLLCQEEQMTEVRESKTFSKQIKKADNIVKLKYFTWMESVNSKGIEVIQKERIWRDHELISDRKGQRAIKLGGKWRGIYIIINGKIEIIEM
jgi:mRNA-degrading endonuclease YafQ of YafQ-DinJ toxin-antitoxin module